VYDIDRLLSPERDALDLLESVIALGPHDLAQARSALRRLTEHGDADVRLQAHRRLLVHLKSMEDHVIAVRSVVSDSDSEVRRAAAFGVAATSGSASAHLDRHLLASVVSDATEEDAVRGAAYEALVILDGRGERQPLTRDVDLARDVDWDWVRSLADTT
jgi:HEAT repeat protein